MATDTLDTELAILFGALCDGLRQEVRTRQLAALSISGGLAVSLTEGREAELASSIQFQLRLVGFFVQNESYFDTGDLQRRPDFRIWLPASEQYLYLELKPIAWGTGYNYYLDGVLEDIDKLSQDAAPENRPNGVVAIGFSRRREPPDNRLQDRCRTLSQQISTLHPEYQEVGVRNIPLQDMDPATRYAMVCLWVRKPS